MEHELKLESNIRTDKHIDMEKEDEEAQEQSFSERYKYGQSIGSGTGSSIGSSMCNNDAGVARNKSNASNKSNSNSRFFSAVKQPGQQKINEESWRRADNNIYNNLQVSNEKEYTSVPNNNKTFAKFSKYSNNNNNNAGFNAAFRNNNYSDYYNNNNNNNRHHSLNSSNNLGYNFKTFARQGNSYSPLSRKKSFTHNNNNNNNNNEDASKHASEEKKVKSRKDEKKEIDNSNEDIEALSSSSGHSNSDAVARNIGTNSNSNNNSAGQLPHNMTLKEAEDILKKYNMKMKSSDSSNDSNNDDGDNNNNNNTGFQYSCESMKETASFFNNLTNTSKSQKQQHDFVHVTNITNFIKASLITQYVATTEVERNKKFTINKRVLDLGCNCKDISKYTHSNPQRYVGVDLSAIQLAEAEKRWKKSKMPFPFAVLCVDACVKNWWQNLNVCLYYSQPERVKGESRTPLLYEEVVLTPSSFDVISCQQMLQFAFATRTVAEDFLDNVSTLLRKDGFFFGTMPDFAAIQTRLNESKGNYASPFVTLKCDDYKNFKTCSPYLFTLNNGSCNDCVEYAIGLTDLIDMCQQRSLQYVFISNFSEYLKSASTDDKLKELRQRMNVVDLMKFNTPLVKGYNEHTIKNLGNNEASLRMAIIDAICLNSVFCFRKV